MKFNIKKILPVASLMTAGLIVTQAYQNCAPFPMEGFTVMNSELQGHDTEGSMSNHPVTDKNLTIPTRKQIVVSKDYVASIFKEVFTSSKYAISGNLDTMIDKWVFYKGAQYGGACNYYSSYGIKDCNGSLPNVNLAQYTDDNTVRESFRLQLCDHLLGQDNGVHAALENIGLTTTSAINAANITAAYGLFYRNNPPETVVVNTLLDLNKTLTMANESAINKWRAILSQVCESPSWQLL